MDWLFLLGSLALITLGAEGLVRGASALALRMGVSPLFVGLTIVGFGTSSPELAASLVATMKGSSDVSVGNVVGSNIFNIGVIVGVTALIRPIMTQLRAVRRDLAVAIAAAMVPWLGLVFHNALPRPAGALLVLVLVTYLVLAYRSARRDLAASRVLEPKAVLDAVHIPRTAAHARPWVDAILVVVGLFLLVMGSRVFVNTALSLARAAGISELVIGLTIVSAGTSLPELVTSVVASHRRHPEIAVGNVIGSNIFNMFGILGVCAWVRPQTLSPRVLTIEVPVMLLATCALIPIMRSGGRISRVEGALLVSGYGVYLATLLRAG